jgi:2-oxoglutarate decarboxylase
MPVKTDTVEVQMPAMGDSVVEGTILEWHKAEGDSIAVDETLVEISTDKVDAEVPSPVSGTIVKLHGAEGDSVNVGAVLAEIAIGDAPASTNGAPAPNGVATAAPPASAGKVIDILTPPGANR